MIKTFDLIATAITGAGLGIAFPQAFYMEPDLKMITIGLTLGVLGVWFKTVLRTLSR